MELTTSIIYKEVDDEPWRGLGSKGACCAFGWKEVGHWIMCINYVIINKIKVYIGNLCPRLMTKQFVACATNTSLS